MNDSYASSQLRYFLSSRLWVLVSTVPALQPRDLVCHFRVFHGADDKMLVITDLVGRMEGSWGVP